MQDLASHKVFLYMKGDPAAPQCGFSQMACRILDAYGEIYPRSFRHSPQPRACPHSGADPDFFIWLPSSPAGPS